MDAYHVDLHTASDKASKLSNRVDSMRVSSLPLTTSADSRPMAYGLDTLAAATSIPDFSCCPDSLLLILVGRCGSTLCGAGAAADHTGKVSALQCSSGGRQGCPPGQLTANYIYVYLAS